MVLREACGVMPVFEVSMAAIKGSRLVDIAVARYRTITCLWSGRLDCLSAQSRHAHLVGRLLPSPFCVGDGE